MGGCAAVRHHHPPTGNGLNENAQVSIKAIRNIESLINFWQISPQMELLLDREENEAYVSGINGEVYIIYFPQGGTVKLDLSQHNRPFNGKWLNAHEGAWTESFNITGGNIVDITAPDQQGWFAVLSGKSEN